MSKLARFTQKLFGTGASTNKMAEIGSYAAGTPARFSGSTITPALAQSLSNFTTGLEAMVVGGNAPTLEDFNTLFYLICYQLSYLMQAGIAEYDSGTTYYKGSLVQSGYNMFQSVADSNVGQNLFNSAYWRNVTAQNQGGRIAAQYWAPVSMPFNSSSWTSIACQASTASSALATYGMLTAVTTDGTNKGAFSLNGGYSWTAVTIPTVSGFQKIISFYSTPNSYPMFIAVGSYTSGSVYGAIAYQILTSTGASWVSAYNVASAGVFTDVTSNGSTVLALSASDGKVATSTNGTSWSINSSLALTANTYFAVAANSSIYVAVGLSGVINTIPDITATSWTARTSNTTASLRAVIWDGAQFVAIGAAYTVLTSPDGITWTAQGSHPIFTLSSANLSYGNGFYQMASPGSGVFFAGPDLNFTQAFAPFLGTLVGTAYNPSAGNFAGIASTPYTTGNNAQLTLSFK